MNLRMQQNSMLNVWPAFTDVSIAMLLIFLFFLFIQFVSNSKLIQKIIMEKKQNTIEKAFAEKFPNEIEQSTITIVRDGNLQRFTFSDKILFETNKAILQQDGRDILTAVGELLQNYKTDEKLGQLYKSIQIEGHTDNVPIIIPNRSNWELSSDRAIAVLRLFVDHIGINPRTLTATGYGEYHPIIPNHPRYGHPKNRRIEIVLVYSETEGSQ